MNEVETLLVSMEMPILVFDLCLGTDVAAKSDEFSEKFQMGGGHFRSKNLCCGFWAFI